MRRKKNSTKKQILNHLLNGNKLSHLEAFGVFRTMRLAAYINALRNEGWNIHTTMKQDATGKRYARYSMFGVHLMEQR